MLFLKISIFLCREMNNLYEYYNYFGFQDFKWFLLCLGKDIINNLDRYYYIEKYYQIRVYDIQDFLILQRK